MSTQAGTLIFNTLKDYKTYALVTKSESLNEYEDFRHAACGLVTEVGELIDAYKRHWFYKTELNTQNLIEEVGDVLWYVAVGYHSLDLELPENMEEILGDTTKPSLDMILAKLVRYSSNVFSVSFAYPNEAVDYLDYDLKQILCFLHYFLDSFGCTLIEAANLNILKLKKRYPNGYSQFDALNRDKVNEISHIEPVNTNQ